jgi:hypothetical protein
MAKTLANERHKPVAMNAGCKMYPVFWDVREAWKRGPRDSDNIEKRVAKAILLGVRLRRRIFKDEKKEVEQEYVSCMEERDVPWRICVQKDSVMPVCRARSVRSVVRMSRAERRVEGAMDVGILGVEEKAKRRVTEVPVTKYINQSTFLCDDGYLHSNTPNIAPIPFHGNRFEFPLCHVSRICRGLRMYCFEGRGVSSEHMLASYW